MVRSLVSPVVTVQSTFNTKNENNDSVVFVQ